MSEKSLKMEFYILFINTWFVTMYALIVISYKHNPLKKQGKGIFFKLDVFFLLGKADVKPGDYPWVVSYGFMDKDKW